MSNHPFLNPAQLSDPLPFPTPPTSPWLQCYSRIDHYPKLWSKGIIQRALIRWAGDCCESCGVDSNDALLHVHHLTWKAKHDCTWPNLAVLCTSCHVRVHNLKWQPGKAWPKTGGAAPTWAIVRGHIDCEGRPLTPINKSLEKAA